APPAGRHTGRHRRRHHPPRGRRDPPAGPGRPCLRPCARALPVARHRGRTGCGVRPPLHERVNADILRGKSWPTCRPPKALEDISYNEERWQRTTEQGSDMARSNTNERQGGAATARGDGPVPLEPTPPFARRLRLLKWITVLVPGVFIFVLESTRHQVVEPFLREH